MTPHEWLCYKAKLEKKMREGDESVGKELHDIIVEETGLLYQKPRGMRLNGTANLRTAEGLILCYGLWANGLQRGEIRRLLKREWMRNYGRQCLFCNCTMTLHRKHRGKKEFATIDHIDAIALGGSDVLENIQVICLGCNRLKAALESEIAQYGALLVSGDGGARKTAEPRRNGRDFRAVRQRVFGGLQTAQR